MMRMLVILVTVISLIVRITVDSASMMRVGAR